MNKTYMSEAHRCFNCGQSFTWNDIATHQPTKCGFCGDTLSISDELIENAVERVATRDY